MIHHDSSRNAATGVLGTSAKRAGTPSCLGSWAGRDPHRGHLAKIWQGGGERGDFKADDVKIVKIVKNSSE